MLRLSTAVNIHIAKESVHQSGWLPTVTVGLPWGWIRVGILSNWGEDIIVKIIKTNSVDDMWWC
jgi:hypothetical protein